MASRMGLRCSLPRFPSLIFCTACCTTPFSTFIDVKHPQILRPWGRHKVNRRPKRVDVRSVYNFGRWSTSSRGERHHQITMLVQPPTFSTLVTSCFFSYIWQLAFSPGPHRFIQQSSIQNGSHASRIPDQARQVSLGLHNLVRYTVADLRSDALFSTGQNRSD
jgi:hypothetical protein